MLIHGLKTCDTCRKALKALAETHDVRLRDMRAEPASRAEIERFHQQFGAALVNRASTTWRGLPETEKAGDPVDLLLAHPALMKRPVIEAGGTLTLGWAQDVQQKWLGTPGSNA